MLAGLVLSGANPAAAVVSIDPEPQCTRPPGADKEEMARRAYAGDVSWYDWRLDPETDAQLEPVIEYRDSHSGLFFGSFTDFFEQRFVLVVDDGGNVEAVADEMTTIIGDSPLNIVISLACRPRAVVDAAVAELRSRGHFALPDYAASGVEVQTDVTRITETEACSLEEEFRDVGLSVFFGDAEPHARWARCGASATSEPSEPVSATSDSPTTTEDGTPQPVEIPNDTLDEADALGTADAPSSRVGAIMASLAGLISVLGLGIRVFLRRVGDTS